MMELHDATLAAAAAFAGVLPGTQRPTAPRTYTVQTAQLVIPQVRINNAKGLAFEMWGQAAISPFTKYIPQVSVRPLTAGGALADFRVRLDALTMAGGKYGGVEYKSSFGAELTGNQARGIPLIRQYGAVVVGDNGGPAHPSGLLLPPFNVTLVRPPVDVNRSHNGR